MINCPFELSDSLNSSASISNLSEMKSSSIHYDKTSTQTHIQPIQQFKEIEPIIAKKDKTPSRQSIRMRRCFLLSFIISIPIGLIILLRYLLCSNHMKMIPFGPNYITALRDENDYQLIELSNKIQMALVSTSKKKSDISLFSIAINYGTSNDPKDYKGLSHLILKAKLNMIIGEFVRKNNNGIKHFNLTYRIDEDMSQITYEIDKEYYWDSVMYLVKSITTKEDISDSLLDESLEGVNRKFEGFKNSDSFKLLQVISSIIYSKPNFIGNYKTLKHNNTDLTQLKAKVKEEFIKYYIGNNMKIVIETDNDMNELKEKVQKIFKDISSIPENKDYLSSNNNNTNTNLNSNSNGNVLTLSNLGKVIWIQSHLYLRSLKLIFIIPNSTNEAYIYYEYLVYLMNEKEENTLYQLGIKGKEITDFNAKISILLSTHIQLELNYCLAENGLFSLQALITRSYSYLISLTALSFNKDRFNEFIQIKKKAILFQEEPMQKRRDRLVAYMKYRRSFDNYYCFNEFSYMNQQKDHYLIPENSLIVFESGKVDFLKYKIFTKNYLALKITEPYFEFVYYLMDLDKETIDFIKSTKSEAVNSKWEENKFITKWDEKSECDYEEKANSNEKSEMEPEKIIETNHTIIWHRVSLIF